MSERDWALLAHRHLDGSLDDEEARALSERLAVDPALVRLLSEMAFDQAQLRESMQGARPAEKETPRWSRGSLLAAASILVAVAVALVVGLRPKDPPPAVVGPAAPKPLSRDVRVTGRVQKAGDGPHLALEASAPAELQGRRILVYPNKRSEGLKDQLAFFRKAQAGQEVTLDLTLQDSGEYLVRQLSPEQIEWANQKTEKKKPDPRKDAEKERKGD